MVYLACEAGMSECAYNVGVVQVLGEGYLHWGPVRGALYILVLLWSYDLNSNQPHQTCKTAPECAGGSCLAFRLWNAQKVAAMEHSQV